MRLRARDTPSAPRARCPLAGRRAKRGQRRFPALGRCEALKGGTTSHCRKTENTPLATEGGLTGGSGPCIYLMYMVPLTLNGVKMEDKGMKCLITGEEIDPALFYEPKISQELRLFTANMFAPQGVKYETTQNEPEKVEAELSTQCS